MKVVWLADENSPHVKRWINALNLKSIEVKVYTFPKRRPRFLYILDALIVYIKLRRESDVVVHAHFVSSYGVILSLLPSRLKRVVSVWGSDILVTPKLNRMYRFVIKRALAKADVRIANSRYLAMQAKSVIDLPYLTIPFGIDLRNFQFVERDYLNQSQQPFVIGVVKRLHPVAGIDVLLKAFALASKSCPNIDLNLIIAGSGPEEANLRQLSADLGVQDSVVWEGWCDEFRVVEIFRTMSLVVFPSRVEGLGVSAIEAMASGVPVLAAKQGGLTELIGENEQRGSFFELDPESLATKLLDCITGYKALCRKSSNARLYVEGNYDISVNADQLVELYRNLHEGRVI